MLQALMLLAVKGAGLKLQQHDTNTSTAEYWQRGAAVSV
jgi:hypothetical protein